MQNDNQFDELLTKYLSNETNREEDLVVEEWIGSSDSNRQHFELLRQAWALTALANTAAKVDVEMEWRRFTQASDEYKDAVAEEYRIPFTEKRRTIYRTLVSVAVAASVLLAIGIGYYLLTEKDTNTKPALTEKKQTRKTPGSVTRKQRNSSATTQKITLSDGTEVLLFENSELTYEDPFTGNKRDISVEGKAEFNVTKNASSPFTVYSEDISTTALGTKFSVENTAEKDIVVRLFEGRVVVKSIDSARKKLTRDYFLTPGQELVYNRRKATAVLKRFNRSKAEREDTFVQSENPLLPEYEKGSWYMFNNQSLDQVFDQLQVMYSVSIRYSKQDVHNKYFIGKFDKTDSIEKILKEITSLNKLKLMKDNKGYTISK
jgi:transmembrane sensor